MMHFFVEAGLTCGHAGGVMVQHLQDLCCLGAGRSTSIQHLDQKQRSDILDDIIIIIIIIIVIDLLGAT
jgi:hypothetical protein